MLEKEYTYKRVITRLNLVFDKIALEDSPKLVKKH